MAEGLRFGLDATSLTVCMSAHGRVFEYAYVFG